MCAILRNVVPIADVSYESRDALVHRLGERRRLVRESILLDADAIGIRPVRVLRKKTLGDDLRDLTVALGGVVRLEARRASSPTLDRVRVTPLDRVQDDMRDLVRRAGDEVSVHADGTG